MLSSLHLPEHSASGRHILHSEGKCSDNPHLEGRCGGIRHPKEICLDIQHR